MATEKKRQGDSIWFRAEAEGLAELTEQIAAAWDTWSGKWALVTKAGGQAVLSGTLTRSADVGIFEGMIGASETTTIPVGDYYLVCQADNASVDFSDEFAELAINISAAKIY